MLGVRFDPAMKVNFISRTYCVQEMDTHRDKVWVTEVREIISTAEKFRLRHFMMMMVILRCQLRVRARVCVSALSFTYVFILTLNRENAILSKLLLFKVRQRLQFSRNQFQPLLLNLAPLTFPCIGIFLRWHLYRHRIVGTRPTTAVPVQRLYPGTGNRLAEV